MFISLLLKPNQLKRYPMLKSMTAYGRACVVTALGRFVVEIQSVNRKFLEINTVLPKEFLRFDGEIKKWIASSIMRGQINVKVSVALEQTTPLVVTPNLPLARQIKAAWDKIAEDLQLEDNQGFRLSMLAQETGVLLYDENIEEEQEYLKGFRQAVESALKGLIEMKIREGNELQKDIEARLSRLKNWIAQVAVKAPEATKKYRQKLVERLQEVLPGCVENEEKILREVCVFAERVDIAEEITRFDSHLKQFSDLLNASTESIGKTLEFLLQELNREINTIGSKSSDVEVSRLVIEVKSELERIREQIQNVE